MYVGIAIGGAAGNDACSTVHKFRGERERVRSLAANHALFALLRVLRGERLAHWARDES